MKKLAFWLPSKKKHGLGHYSRSLLLADVLNEHQIESIFFTTEPDEFELSKKQNFFTLRDAETIDIQNFFKLNNVGYLFIDNYFIQQPQIEEVSKYIPTCFFTKEETSVEYDSYFNSNLYAESLLGAKFSGKKCFWGTSYRPNIKKNIPKVQKIYDWFICLGASNPPSILFDILDAIPKDQKVALTLGSGTSEETLLKAKEFPFEVFHHPENFFEIVSQSKHALISSSTLVYEMIEYSIPFSVIAFVENHMVFANYLKTNYQIPVQYIDKPLNTDELINSPKLIKDVTFGDKINKFADYIKLKLIDKD